MAAGNSFSKTAVWILLGLLILGLAGFGATNLSGTVRTVGTVGDKSLSVDAYARALQREISSFQQQTGQSLPFARAQEIGLDRAVLQQQISNRALDHEASQMGLSIGDENLRDRLLDIGAFRGLDGEFDREAYRFSLEQNGLSETQFETQLREEVARTLLQGSVLSGVVMPDAYVDTLVQYMGKQASFTWTELTRTDLQTPLETPSDDALRAHFEANIEEFTLPETKLITYALLSPDALLDEVDIDEDALRQAYEARINEYVLPERRLVEQLAYLDEAGARAALDSLGDEITFETLVADRGLSMVDVDLGDVAQSDLDAAGAEVFAADVGAIVGPLPSAFGPALYRVNGILPARETSFEDAQPELRPALAADRAQRLVDAQAQNLDDLLAGGATLEELDTDTDMVLGTFEWSAQSDDGIAAYEAFRDAAAAVTLEDFPSVLRLDDGGLFAIRLEETLPPRPPEYADVRVDVLDHWQAQETVSRLREQVQTALPQLTAGTSFADLGYDAVFEENLVRTDFVGGAPAGFMNAVFELNEGEVRAIDTDVGVIIVRLESTAAPAADGDAEALRAQLSQVANQALSQDIFDIFRADVTRRADPQINQQALQAVHVNFP